VTIPKYRDFQIAELGSKVEQLVQEYFEAEKSRIQQAAQISELRQEIIVLKGGSGSQETVSKKLEAEERLGKGQMRSSDRLPFKRKVCR
jgi:Mg2+ and Co2+ transporter CorA